MLQHVEDNLTTHSSPPPNDQDIRIELPTGPITRARAKKIQDQVNLFLNDHIINFKENFILPQSCNLLVLRYLDQYDAQEEEELHCLLAHRQRRAEGCVGEKGYHKVSKGHMQLYMDFPKALETFLSSSTRNQSRSSKIGKIEADSDSVYCSQTDVD